MEVISLKKILSALEDKSKVVSAIRQAFISYSKGDVEMPEPVQMLFRNNSNELRGDCHVKSAQSRHLPYFCVKLATGFYHNPDLGLPVNNGAVLLLSSQTGEPIALLQDEGHLTSARTAAAGALAASLRGSAKPRRLGIVGTGHQAGLQAKWISQTTEISQIRIYGRTQEKTEALCRTLNQAGLKAEAVGSVHELCDESDTIVTTTPSSHPILSGADVNPGQHIIALGADSPGKAELDPNIIAKADIVVADDVGQCTDHGELGHAVRANLFEAGNAIEIGHALSDTAWHIAPSAISVVDLTGLGAQDLFIAAHVYNSLT